LHFLLGDVDVFIEVEFEGDDGAAAGADEVICFRPGIWPNWRSRGAVTEEAITSGPPPG